MKNTIIQSVTAIICVAILSVTAMAGINGLAEAEITAAEKFAETAVTNAGRFSDDEVINQEIIPDDSTDTQPTSPDASEPTEEAPTDESGETTPTSTPDAPKTMTTQEIVKLFNTSANKIKTDAKKVVKNYEKRTLNEEKFDIPDALEEMGRNMIKTLMGDDTEPIVYSTKEDIRNEYIVPKQDYVSKLQPSAVAKATCEDKGTTYEIYIRLKSQTNPSAGNGVGAVCDVIEGYEIAEKAPAFIKKFNTEYSDCEIRATIDKATGRMTHSNYKTPVLLDLTVSLFGTHDAKVGFTFEKDYTITY